MQLLSLAVRTCSAPLITADIVTALASEARLWKRKADKQHSKLVRATVCEWANKVTAGSCSEAYSYIKQTTEMPEVWGAMTGNH